MYFLILGENVVLASGSQDSTIRLWKFTLEEISNNCKLDKKPEDALKLESKNFNVVKQDGSVCSYVIQLETVISGHDGWVYGVHWNTNYSGIVCKTSILAVCNFYYSIIHALLKHTIDKI